MRKEIQENTEKLVEKTCSISGIMMKFEGIQRENSDAVIIPQWYTLGCRLSRKVPWSRQRTNERSK